MCPKHWYKGTKSQQTELVNDLTVEIKGFVAKHVHGFSTKHDSGNVRVFGR